MDRETWRATVLGVARVRHDLATKQQQHGPLLWFLLKVFSSSQAPLPKLNIPILIQRTHLPPSPPSFPHSPWGRGHSHSQWTFAQSLKLSPCGFSARYLNIARNENRLLSCLPPQKNNQNTNIRAHWGSWRRRQWHPTPVLLPGRYHGWRKPGGLQSMGSHRV